MGVGVRQVHVNGEGGALGVRRRPGGGDSIGRAWFEEGLGIVGWITPDLDMLIGDGDVGVRREVGERSGVRNPIVTGAEAAKRSTGVLPQGVHGCLRWRRRR